MSPSPRIWQDLSASERGDVVRLAQWFLELRPALERIDQAEQIAHERPANDLAAVLPAVAELERVLRVVWPGLPVELLAPLDQMQALREWYQRAQPPMRAPDAGQVISA